MKDYISSVVAKKVEKFATRDPFVIADGLGIHIIPWHFTDEVQGMYKYERKNKFIFINKDLGEERKFVMAHELGHALLHPKHNTSFLKKNTYFPVSKYEKQANQFAVSLLIPDDCLSEYKDASLSIYEISEMYGVPKELAHLKNF
ncbi:ImmA/IrrE family metallo-endopeptidase [Metabacillus litoralis]|uniref:ImmA/IrrE family metallo-endopeptidase n=1 Tax=Metabacillus litoralis TaxID=152268 RepID=UPI00203A749D|nr:ImmA/IrrE family metallo-endopeptidase [Metabacillus litoralis]MCM3651286.1 ImmA/IrrE family metallo-endopeptidase [Metabacillus litoralis]